MISVSRAATGMSRSRQCQRLCDNEQSHPFAQLVDFVKELQSEPVFSMLGVGKQRIDTVLKTKDNADCVESSPRPTHVQNAPERAKWCKHLKTLAR